MREWYSYEEKLKFSMPQMMHIKNHKFMKGLNRTNGFNHKIRILKLRGT